MKKKDEKRFYSILLVPVDNVELVPRRRRLSKLGDLEHTSTWSDCYEPVEN